MEAAGARVEQLIAQAGDAAYPVRANAGLALAGIDDLTGVADILTRLILDPEDTFVTLTVARALLARGDDFGLTVVLSAAGSADDNHLDWIGAAFRDVCEPGDAYVALRDRARVMAASGDPDVLRAASWLFPDEDR